MVKAGKRGGAETSLIRLAVSGAAGRMGARICTLAQENSRFRVVARIDLVEGCVRAESVTGTLDAVVDFSSDDGAAGAVRLAARCGAALLVGTTGLSRQTHEALEDAARSVPVLVAANTSAGVAVLADLAVRAARLLGSSADVNLIEMHHAGKRDAPSGTALRLAELLRERADLELPRERIHAVRGGDVVGEHTLEFSAAGERLRICHIATSRDLFARGALRAIAWLVGRPPGRYTIEQSLGIVG
jgi:4-hydroxy-tetrahydrodipicolinate reductase